MALDLKKMQEYLDSEEGRDAAKRFVDKLNNHYLILNSQISRLHASGRFKELVEKAIVKYSSDKYRDSWFKRGIEPPEKLFWFLLEYVKCHGRECEIPEWEKYANDFSAELYYLDGYYFNLMHGQGSVVQIIKEEFKYEVRVSLEEQLTSAKKRIEELEKIINKKALVTPDNYLGEKEWYMEVIECPKCLYKNPKLNKYCGGCGIGFVLSHSVKNH